MKLILFFIILFPLTQHTFSQCKKKYLDKEIIGFYASWQFYDREKIAKPENIDYRRFTTLIYSFFEPTKDGHIRGGDQFADETILKGEIDWGVSTKDEHFFIETTSLPYLAHLKKTKVFISLGGWTYSKHISGIIHSQEYRQTFVNECVRLIKEYKIDGIDIDWEFPGYSGRKSDKEQLNILLQEMKTAFDLLSRETKKRYYISVTLNVAPPHNNFLDGDSIGKYVDMINLMCYDFYGHWVPIATHKAALYPFSKPNSKKKVNNVDTLFKIATGMGMPANKLNIGCAFDGRTANYKGTSALYSDASFSSHYIPKSQGKPLFYSFKNKIDSLEYHYDSIAEAPYLVDTAQHIFLTYENERSLIAKTDYVTKQQAMGIFIWDITGDMIKSKSGLVTDTPLLYAIHKGFCREEEIKAERKKKRRK